MNQVSSAIEGQNPDDGFNSVHSESYYSYGISSDGKPNTSLKLNQRSHKARIYFDLCAKQDTSIISSALNYFCRTIESTITQYIDVQC